MNARQPPEQHALGLGQQCVRPVDRGPQRLLAPHRGARASGQQPEPVVQAVEDLAAATRRAPARPPVRSPVACRPDAGRSRSTVAMLSSVTAKSGRAWRARSANRFERFVVERQATAPATSPRRRTPIGSRLVVSTRRRRGIASRSVDDQRGARIQQMLAVVEHQQHLGDRRWSRRCVSIVERPGWSGSPSARATVTGTQLRDR